VCVSNRDNVSTTDRCCSVHLRRRSATRRPTSFSPRLTRGSRSERKSGTAPADWSSLRPRRGSTATIAPTRRSARLVRSASSPRLLLTAPPNCFRFSSKPVLGRRKSATSTFVDRRRLIAGTPLVVSDNRKSRYLRLTNFQIGIRTE